MSLMDTIREREELISDLRFKLITNAGNKSSLKLEKRLQFALNEYLSSTEKGEQE